MNALGAVRPSRWTLWMLLWLAALLAWLAFSLRIGDVRAVLGAFDGRELAGLAALNVGLMLLFSARWWALLRWQGYPRPYLALAGYRLAAFGVSYLTPGPQVGGEPLQVFLVHRRQHVPGAAALASLALDKLLDWLANFTFLVFGLGLVIGGGLLQGLNAWAAGAFGLGMLALPAGHLLALARGGRPASAALAAVHRWQPGWLWLGRVRRVTLAAEEQIALFCRTQRSRFALLLVLSWAIWVLIVFESWLALQFLGLSVNFYQVVCVLTAARLAFLLPMPGGLGVLEASQVFALTALGFDPAYGVGLSLWVRGRDVILALSGLALGAYWTRQTLQIAGHEEVVD